MHLHICFILVSCYFIRTKAEKDAKLLFVQILYRHGDRAPVQLYPNDPNPEEFWTEGLGSLTKLGRQQQYALGKFLHTFYQNFSTFSPKEVQLISADCKRCKISALTNTASFFAPSENWTFEDNLQWQPIDLEYINYTEDRYLEPSYACPRAKVEINKLIDSPSGQEILADHKEMFQNLSFYSGSEIANWTFANFLHDTVWIEKKYNLTIPSWVNPWWQELSYVANMAFVWSFDSPELHQLLTGPFLEKLTQKFVDKISGKLPNLKFIINSAHDTNVALIMSALKIYNDIPPPYCATLLFELYEVPVIKYAIRILYLNSSTPENVQQQPHVLTLNGCTEFCPLDYFVNYTKHLFVKNWDERCQVDKTFVEKIEEQRVNVVWFIGILFVLIVAVTAFGVRKVCKHKKNKYEYHLMPME